MVRDPAWERPESLAGLEAISRSANWTMSNWPRSRPSSSPASACLWADRAGPPPSPTIGVFPAFFAAVLCGASGFALMVLFGIYGLRPMSPAELAFFLVCRRPCRSRGGDRLHRKMGPALADAMEPVHTFYALTDRRAIVGSDARVPGEIAIGYFTSDMFDATLCVEYRDGSGDVFFVQDGDVTWPEWGFRGISGPRNASKG